MLKSAKSVKKVKNTKKKETVYATVMHDDVPEVLDLIETFGNMSKIELVNALYKRTCSTQDKLSLHSYTKGKLMALLVESFYR
jgi:hypothetical protein